MGTESFLVGASSLSFDNIEDAIEDLRDASVNFVDRFSRNEMKRAGEVSRKAFECFDHISNELLRIRDAKEKDGSYAGSAFEHSMNVDAGMMVQPVSLADQVAIATAGPGNGRLPVHLSTPVKIPLWRLLNKVKHRHRTNLNFRIDGGRHMFIVCCHKPDDISEFDVKSFCDLCIAAASAI